MRNTYLWDHSHELQIETGPDIVGGFSIGFGHGISEETKDLLMHYANWVEDHYSMPVTLWVDFEHKHYLRDEQGRRADFRFYWVEFEAYPVFLKEADIPVIRLPVRMERSSMQTILTTFTKAISRYFLWLAKGTLAGYETEDGTVEAVMDAYRAYCEETGHTF